MKNVFHSLLAVLVLILIAACAKEIAAPMTNVDIEEGLRIDTIILFDPVTFEEVYQIVELDKTTSEQKILETYKIQVDTVITFDSDTYEETVQIIRTKVKQKKK